MPDSVPGLPPPRPIPLKERSSILFLEKGKLDVVDGAFVVVDVRGVRTVIPVGGIACLMLEPGTRVSHAAVALAARAGTLLIWVGAARSDRLLYQARLALDDDARLRVVRRMYARRFGEEPPARRSVDQLRGIEGARVRETYKLLAQQHGVEWDGRRYDPRNWGDADLVNRCLSAATAALYGITEAAILAAGYAPAIGFLHTGKPQSFVYDIADLFKFETVVPEAFRVVAAAGKGRGLIDGLPIGNPVGAVRRQCRDAFRRNDVLGQLIPAIEDVLAAGGLAGRAAAEEAMPIAIPPPEAMGDAGHRG